MMFSRFLLVSTALSLSTPIWAMDNLQEKPHFVISTNCKEDKQGAYKLFSEIESICDKKYIPFIAKKNISESLRDILQGSSKQRLKFWAKAYDVALHLYIKNYKSNIEEENIFNILTNSIESINIDKELNKNKTIEISRKGFFMHLLSYCYREGIGTEKNIDKAVDLCTNAAKLKNPHAINDLGYMYSNGIGLKKDTNKAIQLYQQASQLNHTTAMINLSYALMKESVEEKNLQKFEELNTCAANLGNGNALYNLGFIYFNGIGVQQNSKKAIKFYEEAVELEHPSATNDLALIYFTEHCNALFGSSKKREKAINLYERAVSLGSSHAMYNLGLIYFQGKGDIQRNLMKARYLFYRATVLGHSKARASFYQMAPNHGEPKP